MTSLFEKFKNVLFFGIFDIAYNQEHSFIRSIDCYPLDRKCIKFSYEISLNPTLVSMGTFIPYDRCIYHEYGTIILDPMSSSYVLTLALGTGEQRPWSRDYVMMPYFVVISTEGF